MSAQRTAPGAALTMDVSGTPPIPFSRQVMVELRKSADTRAGRWLLIAIVLITAAIMVVFFFAANRQERTFDNFIGIAATPQGFLLPVLGILLVTSEWSQRTAMVTFALEPSRTKVIGAKTVAALIFGTAAFATVVAIGVVCTLLGGADNAFEGFTLEYFLPYFLLQLFTILQGLAYGLILLNTPAAIVAFFVLPIAFTIVANLVGWLRDAAPWIDLGTAQLPLIEGTGDLTGEQWAQLGTTTLIWIVIPFVLGWFRVMRAEVK